MFNNFLFRNSVVYEMEYKRIVKLVRRHVIIWRMRVARWILRPLAYPEGGGLGGSNPPEIIPKFWQSRAEFPVPCKIDLKNLIRIRVSPICKLGGTPDYRVTAPDPCSLCPLSSTEFVEPPRKKFLGTPLPETTNTHSDYVIFTAFSAQQWLYERASTLRSTYSVFFFCVLFFMPVSW
jgi:hypothetical protein